MRRALERRLAKLEARASSTLDRSFYDWFLPEQYWEVFDSFPMKPDDGGIDYERLESSGQGQQFDEMMDYVDATEPWASRWRALDGEQKASGRTGR